MSANAPRVTCKPVDLTQFYNWPGDASSVAGVTNEARDTEWIERLRENVRRLPKGEFGSWGVPFEFASEGSGASVVMLVNGEVTVPIDGEASHVCIAHAWGQIPTTMSEIPREGLVVGEYVLAYDDGTSHTQPIRARFEINLDESPGPPWLAQQLRMWQTVDPEVPRGDQSYGATQYALQMPHNFGEHMLSNYALPNPHAEKRISALTMRCTTDSPLIVAAVTLYQGKATPLRHNPRSAFRIVTSDGAPAKIAEASVDFGIIARTERTRGPCDDEWLNSRYVGVIGRHPEGDGEDLLHLVTAEDATLSVKLEGGAESHEFAVGDAFESGSAEADGGGLRLEMLGKDHQWMTVRVLDEATGQPAPVRVHFADEHGRYIAPYGHHEQVNPNWFEDYGADVQIGGRNWAYVNGEFAVDLPVGDVYVEIFKGFEYEPTREKVRINPGEKTLDLSVGRWTDLRSKGWVTADTHVHFVSPHTAWLQAQGEGVNVVNLLASQWGRLLTNVGDVTGRVGVVEDDTIVYVGTENRNHMLGHMSMLGTQGNLPVYPMCCGGPTEAWVGDPDFRGLAEWALENRRKGGVVVRPHFPYCGFSEDPVSIVKGLVDALEIGGLRAGDFPMQEWYRYLNCGYRVAVCGGTDKMSASTAIGQLRTYAKIDPNEEFTYDAWAEAVRAGRTFSTTGPVMDITADGRGMSEDIIMSSSGGTVEVHATASSFIPLGGIELVVNGNVVAKDESPDGARELELHERVTIERSGWIAARCYGQPGHAGGHVAAHTSPVYVTCGDDRPFDGPAAEHMLSLVQGSIEYLDTLATNYDEESRRRMVKLFDEARQELKGRLLVEAKHQI